MKKIESLQALRTIAFLGIFTSHTEISKLGAWGVSVFFILSGFLMIYNNYDKKLCLSLKKSFEFAKKRIKSLYFLHILTMLIIIPLVLFKLRQEFSVSTINVLLFKVFANIFLLQSWIPISSVYFSLNEVAWYLSSYFFICILFPKILAIIQKYRDKKSAYIMILYTFCIQFLFAFFSSFIKLPIDLNFSKWLTYICPLFRLGDFFVGCNLGYIFLKTSKNCQKTNIMIFTIYELMLLIFIVFSQYIYNKQSLILGSEWCRYTILFLPSSILLVYLFAINKGFFTKILTNKIIIYIGNISSYTFLIHKIVICYLKYRLPVNKYNFTIICFCFTLIISIVYKKIEERKNN